MESIKNIMLSVMDGFNAQKPQSQEKIQRVWERLINPQELKHTRIVEFENGILKIHIDSSAWLYQFNIKKKIILEQLKEEIPQVQQIIFKIGKVL